MTATAKRLDLCATSDVVLGTALKVEIDDLALAVFNVAGEFFVTDDLCTHGPGSLSEGYIEDDVVECNFHNGQFNIKTGEVVAPPCMIPIKTTAPWSRTKRYSSCYDRHGQRVEPMLFVIHALDRSGGLSRACIT